MLSRCLSDTLIESRGTSDDALGFVLEYGAFDVLMKQVKLAVPELLKLNEKLPLGGFFHHEIRNKST